jgi:hypothetical protein
MTMSIPPTAKIKNRVSAKRWVLLKRKKGETKFTKIYSY